MLLFQTGFLSSKAPLFLDIATIYFVLLPFLLTASIIQAVKKNYKRHIYSQSIILILTIAIIVLFEIGVRVTGGFFEFSKESNLISYNFLVTFLVVHIIIALAAIFSWVLLYINTYRLYKRGELGIIKESHKLKGKVVFFLVTISCIMGVTLYIFLFI